MALSGSGEHLNWFLDYVFLLPVDFGVAYAKKTSATDVVLLDAITHPGEGRVYLLDTSDVAQSWPSDQLASPITAHPAGTRVYFLTQDGDVVTIADGWKAGVTVRPRFLHIGT